MADNKILPVHPSIAKVMPSQCKYNRDRHEEIVASIRAGNSKATSFRLAGIDPNTGHEWVKFGRDYPEKYPHYLELGEDIEQAIAEYEATRVALVSVAADTGSWQAAAWWLERRNPSTWGRNDTVKYEGNTSPTIQLNQVILADASARELSRKLLRQLASDRADVSLGPGDVLQFAEDGKEGQDTLHSS